MESLTESDVFNSSSSELLASPLNITTQQNVNEDNNSSSQEPLETIPVEQIGNINAKSHNRKYPDITTDKLFMESGACSPFIKPLKQDEDRDTHHINKTIHISISSNLLVYYSNEIQIHHHRNQK